MNRIRNAHSHQIALTLGSLILTLAIAVALLTPSSAPPRTSGGFIAPGRLWGITNITGVVSSPYDYEASLLDYSPPVEDTDYLLPYGAQEVVSFPGRRYDHYYPAGIVYVQGSGYVLKFRTPNGGHGALLHLARVYLAGLHAPTVSNTGQDATARAVGAGYYPGGTAIGVSSWPTDPAYGNGVAGPSNAHLCVLLDAAAAQWFYRVTFGLDTPKPRPTPKPKPKPFPLAAWRHYTSRHHIKPISPYYHSKLSWPASIWTHHRWLLGVRDHGRYYGRGRGAYTKTRFEHGAIFTFARYRTFKVTR